MGQMGRVNIEGDLESHVEFRHVMAHFLPRVGHDLEIARKASIGDLTDFFRLARKRFQEPQNFPLVLGVISDEDLKRENLEHMKTAGWAVPVAKGTRSNPDDPADPSTWDRSGYQVKNSHRHFHWLISSKTNGKKGGRPAKPDRSDGEPEETGRLPAVTGGIPGENRAVSARNRAGTERNHPSPGPSPDPKDLNTPMKAEQLPLLARVWNDHSGGLSKVRSCGPARLRRAQELWRERPEEEFWKDVIQRMARSSWCNGGGERGYRATFDFLLDEDKDTPTKVLEGQYGCEPPCKAQGEQERDGCPRCLVHHGTLKPCELRKQWQEERNAAIADAQKRREESGITRPLTRSELEAEARVLENAKGDFGKRRLAEITAELKLRGANPG